MVACTRLTVSLYVYLYEELDWKKLWTVLTEPGINWEKYSSNFFKETKNTKSVEEEEKLTSQFPIQFNQRQKENNNARLSPLWLPHINHY